MDFVVKRGELLKELRYAGSVVESKVTVPVLSNFLLEATGDSLTITATDLDVTVKCTCPARVKSGGAFTFPAKKLINVVRFLPEADIRFKSVGKKLIRATCEEFELEIEVVSKENFPEIPPVDPKTISLSTQTICHMVKSCIFSVTKEESRYTLSGALMVVSPMEITMVSTDGHRMVVISHDVSLPGLEEGVRVIIPRKALGMLSKLKPGDAPEIGFRSNETHMYFRAGDRLIVSRVLTGQFPNYDTVIPQENDKQVVLNTRRFTDSLKRVSVMSCEGFAGVVLSVKKGELDICSFGAAEGEARERFQVPYKGKPLNIGFNAKYLIDFLSGLESEEIELKLRGEENQALLTPKLEGDFSHQYVLMPMKL